MCCPMIPCVFARFAAEVFGCEMDYAHPELTAQRGIACLCSFFTSLGMPTTFTQIGARAEDIPAMVAHRAEKAGRFPLRRLRLHRSQGDGGDPAHCRPVNSGQKLNMSN